MGSFAHIPLPPLTVVVENIYPKHKDVDINVVDTSKTIIKSIIRAMNLSSDLILKCLQEQIAIARSKAKAAERREAKSAEHEGTAGAAVGKKSKSRSRTAADVAVEADEEDSEEDSDEAESQRVSSSKRARVSTPKDNEEATENEKVAAAAKSAEERKRELLVMQRLNLILEIVLSQIPFVQDKPVLLQPLATLLDILVQGQKKEASPEEGARIPHSKHDFFLLLLFKRIIIYDDALRCGSTQRTTSTRSS